MCNAHKVCLFQVIESREGFVEILSQIEHFLGYSNDLFFFRSCDGDEFLDNLVRDKSVPLELLANLESDIEGTDTDKRWLFARELVIMHGHLGKVHCHLINQVLEAFWCIARFGYVFLFFGSQTSLANMADLQNFLKIHSKEVQDCWRRDLIVDRFENIELE